VYPFRSERSFDPALLATANTVPCVSSLALIGNASGADCRGGGISARGVFDKETRRKPLAFAADAVRYGISTAAWI